MLQMNNFPPPPAAHNADSGQKKQKKVTTAATKAPALTITGTFWNVCNICWTDGDLYSLQCTVSTTSFVALLHKSDRCFTVTYLDNYYSSVVV